MLAFHEEVLQVHMPHELDGHLKQIGVLLYIFVFGVIVFGVMVRVKDFLRTWFQLEAICIFSRPVHSKIQLLFLLMGQHTHCHVDEESSVYFQ